MMRAHRTRLQLSSLFAVCFGLACQSPAEDLRVWQPSDHRNTGNEAAQAQQSDGRAQPSPPGLDPVTLRTWSTQCAMCHGQIGRGDGPQAALFKPPDLSDPEWQQRVTDEQIATSIQQGKGQMPSFKLPEPTLQSLVKLVRLFNREGSTGASANGTGQVNRGSNTRPANAHAAPKPQPQPSPAAAPQRTP